MIDVVKKTPREYSEQSRDFQVLARLYTALFNISKMYADDLKEWVPDIDNKLTTLRSRTVNFVNRHEWDLNDLEAITSCFKYLMRRKGTEEALEACINILMKARGIETGIDVDSVVIDRYGCINIWVAHDNILMGIMEDLIRYLIPTGLTYRIYNYDLEVINAAKGIITDIFYRQDSFVRDAAGNRPTSISQMSYPFNQAMSLGGKTGPGIPDLYKVSPTSDYRGYKYGTYIYNTFVYKSNDGEEGQSVGRNQPFMLYVWGQTLYVLSEKDTSGAIVAPLLTYNATDNTLTISPSTVHIPQGVFFDPSDVNNSEGTLVWNEWD